MIGSGWRGGLAALAIVAAGCGGVSEIEQGTSGGAGGGGPTGSQTIVGVWDGSATFGTMSLTEHTTFASDGTASATDSFQVVGVGACTGALQITDDWTSTASTLSVSGGVCSGQAQCPNGVTIPCGTGETGSQTCTYTLSADGDTLLLTCPDAMGPITFVREG